MAKQGFTSYLTQDRFVALAASDQFRDEVGQCYRSQRQKSLLEERPLTQSGIMAEMDWTEMN